MPRSAADPQALLRRSTISSVYAALHKMQRTYAAFALHDRPPAV